MNLIHGCVAGSRCSALGEARVDSMENSISEEPPGRRFGHTHTITFTPEDGLVVHFNRSCARHRPTSVTTRRSRRRRRTPQVIMKLLSTILALALSIGVVDSFASVDPVDPVDPVPPCEGGYIAASSQCPGAPEEGPSGICSGVRCPGPEDKFGLCTAITCTTETYCCSDITFGICQPRTPC